MPQEGIDVTAALRSAIAGEGAPVNPSNPAPAPQSPVKKPEVQVLDTDQFNKFLAQYQADKNQFSQAIGGLAMAIEEGNKKEAKAAQKLDLDSLKDLPTGEAMVKVAEFTAKQTAEELRDSVIKPIVRDLIEVRSAQEEMTVRSTYPNFDLGKHRDELRGIRLRYPDIPLDKAIKLVATVEELSPDSPTTPTSQDGRVHMETGLGVSAGSASSPHKPQSESKGLDGNQVQALLVAAQKAHSSGNRTEGDRYIDAVIADRFAKTGMIPGRR